MARLLIIRHAQSLWNAYGLWQGQADPPLSEHGRRQAERMARALRRTPLDAVITSDLTRARQTAEILARPLGLVPELEPRLRELDAGHWSGRTRAEIEIAWGADLARYRAGDLDLRLGGGESFRQLARRAGAAIADIRQCHAGRTIAIVTHGGVAKVLARRRLPNAATCWLDGPPPPIARSHTLVLEEGV